MRVNRLFSRGATTQTKLRRSEVRLRRGSTGEKAIYSHERGLFLKTRRDETQALASQLHWEVRHKAIYLPPGSRLQVALRQGFGRRLVEFIFDEPVWIDGYRLRRLVKYREFARRQF